MHFFLPDRIIDLLPNKSQVLFFCLIRRRFNFNNWLSFKRIFYITFIIRHFFSACNQSCNQLLSYPSFNKRINFLNVVRIQSFTKLIQVVNSFEVVILINWFDFILWFKTCCISQNFPCNIPISFLNPSFLTIPNTNLFKIIF